MWKKLSGEATGILLIPIYRFGILPTWLKWTLVLFLLLCVDACSMASGERRFVAGFAESLVAIFLYYGVPLLALTGAMAFAIFISNQTNRKWVSVIAFLVVLILLYLPREYGESISGVGWRMKEMQKAHLYSE